MLTVLRMLIYTTNSNLNLMKFLFFYLDATHTLVCAILLLNSDLHGEVSDWVLYCKPIHQLMGQTP